MCLDGCDTDIALHGLCPHGVVSQVVWGSVAAWADLHGVRLTDDEVLAATTSLDLRSAQAEHDIALPLRLPNLTDLRGVSEVVADPEVVGRLEGFECVYSSATLASLFDAPKMRRMAYVHALSEAPALAVALPRLESFTGFAWSGADCFRAWLFPVPPSLRRLRLGYVDPKDVLDILAHTPPTLRDVAFQGWNTARPKERSEVFNTGAALPAHLEGFELLDYDATSPNSPPVFIRAFIAPAIACLRNLALSAPLTPGDVEFILCGCHRLEEWRLRLWQSDDTATARRLLFTNDGLPLLRRLAIDVVGGSGSWAALEKVADKQGRSTVTALSLGLASPVTGEQLRPFAPRLSEVAVRELSTPGGYFPTCPLLVAIAVKETTVALRAVFSRQRELMPRLRSFVNSGCANSPPLPFEVSEDDTRFNRRGRFDCA